jgi:hypothetical protein
VANLGRLDDERTTPATGAQADRPGHPDDRAHPDGAMGPHVGHGGGVDAMPTREPGDHPQRDAAHDGRDVHAVERLEGVDLLGPGPPASPVQVAERRPQPGVLSRDPRHRSDRSAAGDRSVKVSTRRRRLAPAPSPTFLEIGTVAPRARRARRRAALSPGPNRFSRQRRPGAAANRR